MSFFDGIGRRVSDSYFLMDGFVLAFIGSLEFSFNMWCGASMFA